MKLAAHGCSSLILVESPSLSVMSLLSVDATEPVLRVNLSLPRSLIGPPIVQRIAETTSVGQASTS